MSASYALAAVKTLYDVVNSVKHIYLVNILSPSHKYYRPKVKDNRDELLRLSQRIKHIVAALNESGARLGVVTLSLRTNTTLRCPRSFSMVSDPSKMSV